jgi:hypothetical protein
MIVGDTTRSLRHGSGWASNPRAAFATRATESADDHFIVIERVIEVGDDSPEVDAANAGNGD